jgi:D-3-phosphoglycerate dehydrogenase
MDILIAEKMAGPALERLKADFKVSAEPELWRDQAKLLAAVRETRALIVRNQTQVTAELIAAAPNLQVIGRAGVGLDNIDVPACTKAGVVIVSTPDQNSISVAELAIGMMLGLGRMLPLADRHTKGGGWDRQKFVGVELYGKTLGLVGLGRIGVLTALRARGLGMKIIAHDNYVNPDSFAVTETQARLVPLDELLKTADFVSCHVPLTPATKHLFNYERFSLMKPEAFFLNLARGEVVNEADLARALQEKKLAGAALDVREHEPARPGPLDAMDNVILTPHIAAFTREGQARVNAAVCADVARVLRGERPNNFVNLPKPARLQPA